MIRKIIVALIALTGAMVCAGSDDVFKITAADEGMITKEFISQIRKGVGDKKASCASAELDRFVRKQLMNSSGVDRKDIEIYYINYLERLYKKAFNAALSQVPADKKAEILNHEKVWQQKMFDTPEYKLRSSYSDDYTFTVSSQLRYIRLYRNRTRYWECSASRRAEIDRFQGLRVRCIYGEIPIEYNELRRITPLALHGEPVDSKNKTYIEDLATLPIEFCREIKVGKDLYQIGILIPNNDVCSERSTQGDERIVAVWKNREYYACYYLPNHADVRELEVKGTQLYVTYFQVDEYHNRSKRKNNPKQVYKADFTYEIYAPVKITNWLDYYMDGLGNIHKADCCKNR